MKVLNLLSTYRVGGSEFRGEVQLNKREGATCMEEALLCLHKWGILD